MQFVPFGVIEERLAYILVCFLVSCRASKMVKLRVPSLIHRNAWRTFHMGLLLIIVGIVPLFLSISTRRHLEDLYFIGVSMVCCGACFFLMSSVVLVTDHLQCSASQDDGNRVWIVDSPPSYDEAVAMPRPVFNPSDVDSTEELIISVPSLHRTTRIEDKTCITLPDAEYKSSACWWLGCNHNTETYKCTELLSYDDSQCPWWRSEEPVSMSSVMPTQSSHWWKISIQYNLHFTLTQGYQFSEMLRLRQNSKAVNIKLNLCDKNTKRWPWTWSPKNAKTRLIGSDKKQSICGSCVLLISQCWLNFEKKIAKQVSVISPWTFLPCATGLWRNRW